MVAKILHKTSPPLPFSLSKLQMAASKKYDITDTLAHAQKLYESGYVTYPRTGCEYIPEGHFAEASKIIDAIRSSYPALSDMLGGVDLSRKNAAWDDKKITEHHAIIPTLKIPREGTLSPAEQKIYEMICARYALQFLQDYEYEETTVEFLVCGETFRSMGRTVSCPVKGCKGMAVRLVSKKDNRLFWKCAKCGNFFDDADGKPEIREKKTNREG